MIKGVYFDGETSAKKDICLTYTDAGIVSFNELDIEGIKFKLIEISSRIGNTPRYINFPDGSLFETEDNDAIDQMVNNLSDDSLPPEIVRVPHRLRLRKQKQQSLHHLSEPLRGH